MPSQRICPGTISWIATEELCPSLPPWQNKYSPLSVLRLGSAPPLPSIRPGQHEFIGARNGYMPCNQDLGSGDISIGAFEWYCAFFTCAFQDYPVILICNSVLWARADLARVCGFVDLWGLLVDLKSSCLLNFSPKIRP